MDSSVWRPASLEQDQSLAIGVKNWNLATGCAGLATARLEDELVDKGKQENAAAQECWELR